MKAIVLFGSPGSGKGTQARMLSQCLGIPHISTGDMLRERIRHGSELGKGEIATMHSGALVSDDVVNRMVEIRLSEPDASKGFVLDGFPRTLDQAEHLCRWFDGHGIRELVIYLAVDYNIVIARLTGRRQCPRCGTLYNVVSQPPRVDELCDLDGTKLVVREDDGESVIRERLDAYERQTRPVLDFLVTAGRRVIDVNASNDPPAVIFQKICQAMEVRVGGKRMIVRKTAAELEKMRRSGLLVWQILHKLKEMAVEGSNTLDLEVAAEKMIADAGARPAFKGYYVPAAGEAYRFVLCTSVNDEIVHGMPNAKRVLKKGDIVSIDTGVKLDGYYGDSAITVPIGEVNEETQRLLRVTQESLEMAIDRVRAGNRLFDVCGTVEQHVKSNGFSIVREYVGHGIGTQLHEEPQVPNYVDRKNENPRLKAGMVLAVEPMVNAGRPEAVVLKDKWTAVTKDGSNSAHFEHCIAVTENGPWVLTRP